MKELPAPFPGSKSSKVAIENKGHNPPKSAAADVDN